MINSDCLSVYLLLSFSSSINLSFQNRLAPVPEEESSSRVSSSSSKVMVLCQECNLGSKELEECISTKSDTIQLLYVYSGPNPI